MREREREREKVAWKVLCAMVPLAALFEFINKCSHRLFSFPFLSSHFLSCVRWSFRTWERIALRRTVANWVRPCLRDASECVFDDLDFLPYTCDSCQRIFWCVIDSRVCDRQVCSHPKSGDHWQHRQHACPKADSKNVCVPTCPVCSKPVSVPRGQDPNRAVRELFFLDLCYRSCPRSRRTWRVSASRANPTFTRTHVLFRAVSDAKLCRFNAVPVESCFALGTEWKRTTHVQRR